MRRAGVIGVVLLSLLTGCVSAGQAWTPGPIITESVTPPPVTVSPSSTTPAKPTVPDSAGALDVSTYESAHFASPTGRIWCALSGEWVLCHFPRDMNTSKVPKSSKVCPGADLDVTGVSVTGPDAAEYFCSGGAEAMPQTDGDYTAWWPSTGYPKVRYEKQDMATVPYGYKLVHGDFVCLSEQSGMLCGNTTTGAGFKVSRAGVTLIT